MGLFRRKTVWQSEWKRMLKKEAKFSARRKDGPTSLLLFKLNRFLPKKLSGALNTAFFKAFTLVFNKGSFIIEKSFRKKKKREMFDKDKYALELNKNKKNTRTFAKRALGTRTLNLFLSTIEGLGFGLIGAAMPDIPIFIGIVIKSVYEVALSFGYDYENEAEQIFILKIIEAAMCDDEEFVTKNDILNSAIDVLTLNGDNLAGWEIEKEEQMKATSYSLSKEMIYTKFIEMAAIVGIFGGIFDPIYLKRITDYAVLKYRRRFIGSRIFEERNKNE